MRINVFILFSLAFLSFNSLLSEPDNKLKLSTLFSKLAAQPKLTTAQRIEVVSEMLLGQPFADGPLGEGENGVYDRDPLWRLDKFDCMTFVETVLAAAISSDETSFEKNMNRVRYSGGTVGFTTRNHFVEADWLPNNIVREGLLKEVTQLVGADEVQQAKTTVEFKNWYKAMGETRIVRPDLTPEQRVALLENLKNEGANRENQSASLDYIPYRKVIVISNEVYQARATKEAEIKSMYKDDKAKLKQELAQFRAEFLKDHAREINTSLLEKIPSGSIVNYIHPDRPLKPFIGTNMIVTHQGFLIRKDGVLYTRHASINDKVVDVPFLDYINIFLVPGKLDSQGFNIIEAN